MRFLYVNSQNYIHKIITEKIDTSFFFDISKNCVVLPNEVILQSIQSNKHVSIMGVNHEYEFMVAYLYNVNLEIKQLQSYLNNQCLDVSKHFFKPIYFVQDVVIPNSLPLFHDVNSFFFVFKEKNDTFNKPIITTKKHTTKKHIITPLPVPLKKIIIHH